jgi:hypothetical protein
VVLFFVVGSQLTLASLAIWNKPARIVEFYCDLADERLKQWKLQRDYIESYKHVREHGNAMSIVFLEIALGFVLSQAQSKTQLVLIVLVWVTPSTLCWLLGTALEAELAKNAPKSP